MTADKPSPFVPKLRFPEFRDAPDWEEVPLGTLLVRAPDYGVNAAAVPFSETLPTYIRITDINSDGQFAPCPRVSVDIDATDERYLKDGDIVLARTGASVGKSYRYREEDGRLVYAGFLIRVRRNPERLSSKFLAAYLSTWSYWDWVRLTSERSGQPGINATEYASIPLPLPTVVASRAGEDRQLPRLAGRPDRGGGPEARSPAAAQTRADAAALPAARRNRAPSAVPGVPRMPLIGRQDRCRDIARVLPGYGFPEKFQGNKKGQYPFYKVSDISHMIENGQRYISEANNYIDSECARQNSR